MMKKMSSILAVGLLAISAQAAVIGWGTAQNITGDTDVSTGVSSVYAVTFGAAATTINGVTFDAAPGTTGNANVTAASMEGAVPDTFNSLTGPTAAALSANYKTLLGGGLYAVTTAATASLTLNNLTVGQDYQIQLWAHRDGGNGAAEQHVDGIILDADNDGVDEIGQFIIGTFTADATTQNVASFAGSNNYAVLSGLSLVAVPEPATIGLLGIFGGGMLFIRRKLAL